MDSEEDRMSLLKKFASLFRGEPAEPVFDTAAIGMIGRAYEAEPAPAVLPLPEQGAKPKPYTIEQFIKDTIHIPRHEANVDLYDVIPAETRVKLNCGAEGTIVAQYVNRTGRVCYQVSIDGQWSRSPLPIYSRDGFEIISRPATHMTLVIETPKS